MPCLFTVGTLDGDDSGGDKNNNKNGKKRRTGTVVPQKVP